MFIGCLCFDKLANVTCIIIFQIFSCARSALTSAISQNVSYSAILASTMSFILKVYPFNLKSLAQRLS